MHMMNLNHMAPVVHLNIDGKDEWFIFVQENIFRSLMWALIGIKSEVSASDLMHKNCERRKEVILGESNTLMTILNDIYIFMTI